MAQEVRTVGINSTKEILLEVELVKRAYDRDFLARFEDQFGLVLDQSRRHAGRPEVDS
jgi:hypothetical protein